MGLDNFFKSELKRAVETTQDSKFNFTRPSYALATTSELPVVNGRLGRVDAYSSAYSKTKVAGVEYYSLFFDRANLQAGDIVIKTPASQIPPITILEIESLEECVGFRTSRVGAIYDARGMTARFSNVRFDFFSVMSPEPGILGSEEFGSPDIETRKACCWMRPSIKNGQRLKDNSTGELYQIDQISGTGNLMILSLVVAAKR